MFSRKDINSPDSGIQADHSDDHHSDDQALDDTGNHGNREMKYKSGPVNEDIYAVPEKKTSKVNIIYVVNYFSPQFMYYRMFGRLQNGNFSIFGNKNVPLLCFLACK